MNQLIISGKKTILTLSEYAHTIVVLYEEDENKRREILDEIDKIEDEICKIEENINNKDKSAPYYNLIKKVLMKYLISLGNIYLKKMNAKN
ncbi:MAG: hypothetical protein ACO2OX_01115 [Candidatus Nanopusillus sp.]